jgi:hypothetical protein
MLRPMKLFGVLLLAAMPLAAQAAPSAVPTFHSIGLYWSPAGASESNVARVEFRKAGGGEAWRRGLDLWFDPRNREYRGSLVELEPGTQYEIRIGSETISARTWSEKFPVKRTVDVSGQKRVVISAEDSGDEKGYVVFTAPPGRNVIEGNDDDESCVVVRQGAHHVIIRGLVLRNCKRYGVMLERKPERAAQTHDIVIEDNEIAGWGGRKSGKKGADLAGNDGAIHCRYYRETDDARRPDRIVVQGNRIRDPRHGSNPWRSAAHGKKHPTGPMGVMFERCGRNHVIRYNDIGSANGNHYNDGIGGSDNFSAAGFPWADSDIYGNRISQAYDDGIEAEGGNRNVRIWGNYLDEVFTAIANASVTVGPLYVWRNVSNRMGGMNNPELGPDREERGPFIKGGSRNPQMNGGRAYYFHNTALQPAGAGARYPLGAGWGISKQAGTLFNFVSRNNIWQIHKEPLINGEPKFWSIRADGDKGPIDADYDLYNGQLANAGHNAERHGFAGRPVFESKGSFALKKGSPGHGTAVRIPNFNDQYPKPDVGAHQSGTPPMRFGAEAL